MTGHWLVAQLFGLCPSVASANQAGEILLSVCLRLPTSSIPQHVFAVRIRINDFVTAQ